VLPFSNPSPRSSVLPLEKEENRYEVELENWKKYRAKNIIISSGGKSFFQVWTTWEWYNFAENFWIKIIPPHRALCWLTTKKDFKELSWSSMDLWLTLMDNKKEIYTENWPLLFTHFWISWPIVFNTANALGEYLNSINIESEEDKIKYILKNIRIELSIDKEKATKKIIKFFEWEEFLPFLKWVPEGGGIINVVFWLQDWRGWKEAKATGWWIDINELDNHLQSKKYDWLYFIWEVVDVTWKTWGFNLQWAWSSAFVAVDNIKK
jgi:predicted flavoprotein YhiN